MTSTKLVRFQVKPGQHVYLSMPSKPTCTGSKSLLSNPFTVSDVTASEIALVLRARRGPTTQTLRTHADRFKTHPLISLEGPYGGFLPVAKLASSVDRILLVAGGIGATFILPIYRALQEQLELEAGGSDRLNLTWALRSAAEADWATDSEKQTFAQSSNAHIYLTRHHLRGNALENTFNGEGMEMDELRESDETIGGVKPLAGRPDLKDIVDETFSYHVDERVAVIFCGPQGMGRELRNHVGKWGARGRAVIWHQESFGW
jgi:NAD(P)H-flavin reductase